MDSAKPQFECLTEPAKETECTVSTLKERLTEKPELQMSLQYDYGRGKLRFWRVNSDSMSALDGVGNRVVFRNNSEYLFKADGFSISDEYAMNSRGRMSV